MATDVERLAVLIEANTKSYERAMARMQQQTDRAIRGSTQSVDRLDARLKTMSVTAASFAAKFGVAFGAAGVTGLIRSVGNILDEADRIGKVADKVGLTTDELQKLRYAAGLAGVETNNLDTAMQRFSRRVADAAAGNGELAAVFQLNNIALRDQHGELRSQMDILGDYADLIKNAGSEQEQLLLAFKAFDTEGAAFVNALKDGRAGLAATTGEAERLGFVLDENLIRKSEQIKDEWARFTMGLSTEFKTFVLDVVTGTADATNALDRFFEEQSQRDNPFGAWLRGLKTIGEPGGPWGGPAETADKAAGKTPQTINELWSSLGWTKPGSGSTRVPGTADTAAASQQKRYEQLAAALQVAHDNLAATDREQAVANALLRLGADATETQRQKIEALAGQLYDGQQQLERFNQVSEFFGSAISDSLTDLIVRGKDAGDVMASLTQKLLEAAVQASLLGQGPLAAFFGTAPAQSGGLGGFLGALFGGFRAGGGSVMSNRAYVVGEKGPELFIPKTGGTIAANSNVGGRSVVVSPVLNIDARGADPASAAKVQAVANDIVRQSVAASLAAVRQGLSNDPRFLRAG